MSLSVLMIYDKTIYMTTYLVSLETRAIGYLFSINRYYKCEDTPNFCRNTFLNSFLKVYCMLSAFDRFSRHLKKLFQVQIFLPTWLVKISYSLKIFKGADKRAQLVPFPLLLK